MKKIALVILCGFFVTAVFAQDETDIRRGMKFSLQINNYFFGGRTDLDKRFFGGNRSAMVEFLAVSLPGAGFRSFQIMQNSADSSYTIEARYRPGDFVAMSKIREFKRQGVPDSEWKKRLQEEGLDPDSIQIWTLPVSDFFAKKIHAKFNASIDTFDPGGPPPLIMDGWWVILRCAVDNEIVKTLNVDNPVREINKLSTTCVQLIKDLQNGQMDESKYINLLE